MFQIFRELIVSEFLTPSCPPGFALVQDLQWARYHHKVKQARKKKEMQTIIEDSAMDLLDHWHQMNGFYESISKNLTVSACCK